MFSGVAPSAMVISVLLCGLLPARLSSDRVSVPPTGRVSPAPEKGVAAPVPLATLCCRASWFTSSV